jgi:hypothetical protein
MSSAYRATALYSISSGRSVGKSASIATPAMGLLRPARRVRVSGSLTRRAGRVLADSVSD